MSIQARFRIEYRHNHINEYRKFQDYFSARHCPDATAKVNVSMIKVALIRRKFRCMFWLPGAVYAAMGRERAYGRAIIYSNIFNEIISCPHHYTESFPMSPDMTNGHVLCGYCHSSTVEMIKARTSVYCYVCDICMEQYGRNYSDPAPHKQNHFMTCLDFQGHMKGGFKASKEVSQKTPYFIHGLGPDDCLTIQICVWDFITVTKD